MSIGSYAIKGGTSTCLLYVMSIGSYAIKGGTSVRVVGGGGVQVLNLRNTSELVPRGWCVPVIELEPRVLILQIIGQ